MGDSYHAIYDAVRSKISNGDIGSVISEAARNAFDISWLVDHLKQEFMSAAHAMQAPHVLMRPSIYPDGNIWCALYGDDLQSGVAGFGETPALACADFDKNWNGQRIMEKPNAR